MNLNATLVIEIISFLILLFILYKFLYRPLLSFMDKRQKAVRDMIESAQSAEEKAKVYAEQTHKALDMAKEEILKIKEENRKISDAQRRKILEQARKEALVLIAEAKARLSQERESVIKEIKSEIAAISVDIAKRVLGREIKPDDHKRLIEESIAQIEDVL